MRVWYDELTRQARCSHPDYPNGKELKGDLKVFWEDKYVPAASYASEEEGHVIGVLEVKELNLKGKVVIKPAKREMLPIYTLGSPKTYYVAGKSDGTLICNTEEYI